MFIYLLEALMGAGDFSAAQMYISKCMNNYLFVYIHLCVSICVLIWIFFIGKAKRLLEELFLNV